MPNSPEPPASNPSPNPQPNPQPRASHRRYIKLLKILGAGLGATAAVAGVIGVIWGDRILTAQVLPRVEAEIEDIIERPFKLGDVEGFAFWGVRLGTSTMSATATDDSSAVVDAVDVKIDLRALLFEQTLRPKIVLIRPEVSLAQSETGEWLEIGLPEPSEEESALSLEIQTIEIQDAQLTASVFEQDNEAVSLSKPLQATKTDVSIDFSGEDNEQVSFDLAGKLSGEAEDGNFNIKGKANLAQRAVNAMVRSQALPATSFNLLLPEGIGIGDGTLNSNLVVKAALTEEGTLNKSAVDVRGTARLQNGEVLITELPKPVSGIDTQLSFKGQQVTVEKADLQVGEVTLVASGDADWENGYNLEATLPSVTLNDVQTLTDGALPVDASGAFQLTTQVRGQIDAPRLRGRLANLQPLQIDQLGFTTAIADFVLTPAEFDLTRLRLVPQAGGTVLAEGQVGLDNLENPSFKLTAQAELPTDTLAQTYGIELPKETVVGSLAADVAATGTLNAPSALAEWQLSGGDFPGQGELAFADNVVSLNNTRLQVADGTLSADGSLQTETGSWQATALTNQVSVDVLAQKYGIVLPAEVVAGRLAADAEAFGNLNAPVESATAFAQWQLSESTFPGQGELALAERVVVLNNTRLRVAEGTVDADATLQLANGDWQASVVTAQVPIEQFTTQAEGLLSADVDAAGNLGAINLNQIQAGGTAAIANAQVRLPSTNEPLLEKGPWTTAFQWQGDRIAVNSFSAPGLQANGTIGVDFTQQIPIDRFNLDVALQSFDLAPLNSFAPPTIAEYAQVTGLTSFDGQLTGTLTNPQINGTTRLDNFALNDLLFEPLAGPIAFSFSEGGRVNLQGTDDLIQLSLSENTWPTTFEVRNQDFVAKGYGQNRQLHADILQLPLEQLNIQPPANSQLRATFGKVTGELTASVDANLADFSNPIVDADITVQQPSLAPVDAQTLTASLSYKNNTATLEQSELLFEDSRYLLTGSASLAPDIAYAGQLTIAEGQIEDLTAVLEKLDLSAFGPSEAPTPFGSAADLNTQPVGLVATNLLGKLKNFVAFVEANPPEESDPGSVIIPPLENLAGGFTGVIEVAGASTALKDLSADFDLQGNSWTWGTYSPENEFAISGEIEDMTLALDTAVINAGETAINLSGTGNLDRLDGELTIDNLPVEVAEAVYPLPVNIAGELDVVTTFDGSLANPVIAGEAAIANTQINDYALSKVSADFSYRNAQLKLDSEVAIAPDDTPITLAGNLLYALPFMTVQPPAERIDLKAVVPGDSFDFVNVLTADRVRWEGGTGEVVVQVDGTLSEPIVEGKASFRDGLLASTLLSDPISNLNGAVLFDLKQVSIQQMQASIGDGQLAIAGQLPLLASGQSLLATPVSQQKQQPNNNGLVISLNDLPLDYSGLLEANFQGRVFVTGAVLEPTISGGVEVANGQVQANKLLGEAGSINLPTEEELEEVSPYRLEYFGPEALDLPEQEQPEGLLDRIALNNFEITFGDRLAILGQPFYNISALGDITINGPLSNLQPNGTIALKSGWINLFSTQFRLDTSAPNTATFLPENGLDPYVDVVMEARVQNSDITPAPRKAGTFVSSEIEVNPGIETIGEIQFVEVQAVAQGPASELSDSLSLTSNSSLGQGELLALLSSSAFSDITTASYTQLAGFLGAGNLATLGDNIADAIGLQSFSVFPTTDTSPDSSVGIGLGLQATASISDRIEVNILEILNSNNPPQLGLQYRITDELDLRGSSNLDDTDIILEYKIDF
ncbi:MAG: translocation/assembly module TamB domain-containing protein [Cyanobacteria bacterium P01_A01_bin.116]